MQGRTREGDDARNQSQACGGRGLGFMQPVYWRLKSQRKSTEGYALAFKRAESGVEEWAGRRVGAECR